MATRENEIKAAIDDMIVYLYRAHQICADLGIDENRLYEEYTRLDDESAGSYYGLLKFATFPLEQLPFSSSNCLLSTLLIGAGVAPKPEFLPDEADATKIGIEYAEKLFRLFVTLNQRLAVCYNLGIGTECHPCKAAYHELMNRGLQELISASRTNNRQS